MYIMATLVIIVGIVLTIIKKTRKIGLLLVGIGVIISLISFLMSPDLEGYKKDAKEYSFEEYVDDKVSGSTKVKLTGTVTYDDVEEVMYEDTFILEDNDGLYYVRNEDEAGTKFKNGDDVTVYGAFVGKEAKDGFPKIIAKVIEKSEQ
jgi:hypothetical protein